MRLGGWWRLWIGVSGLWIVSTVAIAFLATDRPTEQSVSKSLGFWCGIDLPVPPDLAGRVLRIPEQLARIKELDGEANAASRKPIVASVKSTVEELAARSQKGKKVQASIVGRESDEPRIVISPAYFTDAQVLSQAESEEYKRNAWYDFDGNCAADLREHSKGLLYPQKLKEWALYTVAAAASIPTLSLILGALFGWIWRGFRKEHRKRE